MPPIKMLALDLDGTLAVNNHQVLPATRTELKNLHETGVEVVIATGRRYRTTRFVIDNLGFDVYAVCNGGALVKTPNAETHHETTYSMSELNDIVSIARDTDLTLFSQHGLSKVASLFNLEADNICAVGDQLNDLPMLKAVGHGVAMGNGNKALHSYTKFVCGNHDEDGILEVIEYIGEHNHKDRSVNER